MNHLYYGDNLDVLRRYVADESVDLIYLDPPFNSNANYNVLFAEQDGKRAVAQIKAFGDTWRWDESAAEAYAAVVEAGGRPSRVMQAFRTFLGDSNMLAYLSMMAPRLIELRRALKPTGSIYLHCDPTASHYLKLLMDAVFGPENYRNEVVWCYRGMPSKQKAFLSKHDTILFYSRTGDRVFNTQYDEPTDGSRKTYESAARIGYNANQSRMMVTIFDEEKYRKAIADGKIPAGMRETQFTDGKPPMRDWWEIKILGGPGNKERLGYPTQKPEALLERIIKASSNEGDVVLDPFCGCGTTISVAEKLGRRWIGIDITHLAVGLIKHRLADTHGPEIEATYQTIGEPTSLPGARELAKQDPFQFQAWALGLVGARLPSSSKKGADKGIDGRLYFHDSGTGGKTSQVIFSVKAGKNVSVSHIRDLGHVVTRENAQIGVLISMEPATKPMRAECAGAGFYESQWGTKHPRLQLLTIRQLLDGKGINMPTTGDDRTFKKAPRATTTTTYGLPYTDK